MAGVNLDDIAIGGTVIVTTGRVLQNVTFSGVFAFASASSTVNASAGDTVHPNGRGPRGSNALGTASLPMVVINSGNQLQLHLNSAQLNLNSPDTATTVGAAGGGSALPATPSGYLRCLLGGVARKIPYYND